MSALKDKISVADGITKYTIDSRTELEFEGKNDAPRGAWDKLKTKEELAAMLAEGTFMDLIRFKSGNGGKVETGYILADRVLAENDKAKGTGVLADGTWTVTITRPLAAMQPGGVSFEAGNTYTVGFAVHDDFTSARFHHVSLEYRLALDNAEAEINVVKK